MNIKSIATHEYPDFDSLYSIYLLRKFGESKYHGVKSAKLIFFPAGGLPNEKSNSELLAEGCLTLDILGGFFDHHSPETTERQKHCTAVLVAIDLGIDKDPCCQKILNFIDKNDLYGIGVQSKEAVDQLIAIPNIIKGLNLKFEPNYELTYLVCEDIFDAAYLSEKEWFEALQDISKGTQHRIGGFKILAFSSHSMASAKAGRFKQADLCIIQGENDSINLTTAKSLKWPKPDLTKIATVIRLAEAIRLGVAITDYNLGQTGAVLDWYLHESLAFVSHGSFKKTDTPPSCLTLEEIINLSIFCLDPQAKHLGQFSTHYELFRQTLGGTIIIGNAKSGITGEQHVS